MSKSKLMTIDPGGATGVAFGFYDDETPYTLERTYVIPDGVDGVAEVYWNMELFDEANEVVMENYIVRPGQVGDPVALEVIGFIKGVVPPHLGPVNMRLRSDKGKAGFVDKILKAHGLWQTPKMVDYKTGRHCNDAIIHALTWLAFHKKHGPTLDKYFHGA